ncbi:N-formylglutamate amidohydrolase [Rhodoferax ferrireducens]|uniref:N-formylglutamate amidohydrolase n=1 Tax=Rhodoferax ferrireducens TaxID=192843 RepID=UPI001E505641|nr:N-formylglutamate amidohydrolase [Rhodoferax ferrireducens]
MSFVHGLSCEYSQYMVKIELPKLLHAPNIPLVCDSPHSGTHYPADFNYAVDLADLRKCEDTHVEKLWEGVPAVGGTLVHATFPRSYIDTNRTEHDIDVTMLAIDWPGRAEPSPRCIQLGNGLVFSKTTTLQNIYQRQLSVDEVQHRINSCWRPYREALTQALAAASQQHNKRWHLNLHSMPSNAYERLGLPKGKVLADVVLGDLHGAACSPEVTDVVAEAFKRHGYTVSVNDPYAGMDLIRQHGNPSRGHNSLQIELNRALYLNEQTREPLLRFSQIQNDLSQILATLATYIRQQL